MNKLPGQFARISSLLAVITLLGLAGSTASAQTFAKLDSPETPSGYLARILINENPFPGERGYVSEEDSKAGMLAILWVLNARIRYIPAGYEQAHVANVTTKNILDVITAKGQCEGFSRSADGRYVMVPRVEERVKYLLNIANSGSQPGKFAKLLNYAQGLARAYFKSGVDGADRFAGLAVVSRVQVTGRAYAWMTGKDCYNPGGNFVSIPDGDDGTLGGNRFYTLRKDPQ